MVLMFIYCRHTSAVSVNISLGTVIGYGLQGQDLIPSRAKIFLFSTASKLAPGAHPDSYLIGTQGDFPGDKVARASG
jgi:hypothetical protein